jgi:ubiquinone/menaquinone biosynthesis C-methylase UbiE
MSIYGDKFADLYDLFHSEKPYESEAAFVDRLLRAEATGPSERLLDVASGTGKHALYFANHGWTVHAVDQSADMLRVARERASGAHIRFTQADMRDLALPEAGFDAVVCLFDSIGYALTNDAIGRTLAGIRRHLRPKGLFVVEFWHAAPMIRAFEPVRVREWETARASILRISRTSLDVARQLARVTYAVYDLKTDGRFETWTEEHENRYFLVQEMDLLLREAGLEPVKFFAGFDDGAAIDEETWHVVGLARAGFQAPA